MFTDGETVAIKSVTLVHIVWYPTSKVMIRRCPIFISLRLEWIVEVLTLRYMYTTSIYLCHGSLRPLWIQISYRRGKIAT